MKEYVVWNADGLQKFTKGEHVLSDLEAVSENDVKVYKIDCDGEPLRNDAGNNISYYLAKARLKSVDAPENAYEKAGVLEKRVMKKTFTDENLDLAADEIAKLEKFNKAVCELREKLGDISKKLLNKISALYKTTDDMDSEKFISLMKQVTDVTEFLEDKPMSYIKDLRDHLCGVEENDDYDPAEEFLGKDDD